LTVRPGIFPGNVPRIILLPYGRKTKMFLVRQSRGLAFIRQIVNNQVVSWVNLVGVFTAFLPDRGHLLGNPTHSPPIPSHHPTGQFAASVVNPYPANVENMVSS